MNTTPKYDLSKTLPQKENMRKQLSEDNIRRASNPDQPVEPDIRFGKQPLRADLMTLPNPKENMRKQLPEGNLRISATKSLSTADVMALPNPKENMCKQLSEDNLRTRATKSLSKVKLQRRPETNQTERKEVKINQKPSHICETVLPDLVRISATIEYYPDGYYDPPSATMKEFYNNLKTVRDSGIVLSIEVVEIIINNLILSLHRRTISISNNVSICGNYILRRHGHISHRRLECRRQQNHRRNNRCFQKYLSLL